MSDKVPHRDKKRLPAPEQRKHLSPHQKPKVWTLRVQFTTTTDRELVRSFNSKAERDQCKLQVERYFREEAALALRAPRRRYFYSHWYSSPLRNFNETESNTTKSGPTYVEEYHERE